MIRPERPRAAVRRARRLAWLHPRWLVALKAACASGLAWLLVQPVGGFVHDYPYYAPLGAVVAMSTTVAGSVRYSVQAVAAIGLGGALAILTMATSVESIAAVAIVIGVGTIMAGWGRLGAMGSWVPIAGLFVLIVGRTDPWQYVLAYAGLTAVGAVVGTAVNAALPQLPMTPLTVALAGLRSEMARQLEDLADALESEEQVSSTRWEAWQTALDPRARRVEELLTEGLEARRGNWRARRWHGLAERRQERARALRYLSGCVEEVIALASDPRFQLHDADDEATRLRGAVARALRASAAMIRTAGEEQGGADQEEWDEAADAVRALRRVIVGLDVASEDRWLPASAIAIGLERAVDAWGEPGNGDQEDTADRADS
ncbi:aromatic acid exporter family protein [Nocardioides sp. DS6]|uniref:Aromatic acid exporter family protein n=1 Tax=Nocardioides eburneus TaxID=3231482 RepID=A0ABV3T3G9_9ACTN